MCECVGKGGGHPCGVVLRESQAACEVLLFEKSKDECNSAVCYKADINEERCDGVIATGKLSDKGQTRFKQKRH